ncbi:filamentous haemagglutinin family protein [Reyranella sp. CPCC 100927]|uniref:filamentous haemagglutinin family protein n=1 Tax=Reyranella sp. CPCC 100927 TaxID=2599616 RepID=UPI0011B4B9B0|nr:filamentous haemagglutinin family protein [Reyranella sp. CPCC 100927]TWT03885.1 filamentous hemagglutinin N-terminal domain-containing protein [Reyranella sp. CPCC 100927]
MPVGLPVSTPFPSRRSVWRRALNAVLLTSVSTITLALAGPASQARDILRGNSVAAPVANVTAQQAAAMQQAQTMARQAQNALARTTRALQAAQAAQVAARSVALTTPSAVPNGLVPGGLVVAPGAGTTPGVWVGADLPTQGQAGARTEVTIRQTDAKAILNWQSFNVGRDTTVVFDQSKGNTAADPKGAQQWIALNRVTDPSGRPSQILGQIKAEGQVYVINRNGIIFGGASQVNVHSLVASSLSLSDAQFKAGINNPRAVSDGGGGNDYGMPQFGDHPTWRPKDGVKIDHPDQVPALPVGAPPGDVRVEAGADLTMASGGKAMLFAPRVTNGGTIKAPDGQVILAAGEQVWLAPAKSNNPAALTVRGLDVAVSAPSPYLYAYYQLQGALGKTTIYNPFTVSLRDTIIPWMLARAESVGYSTTNTGIIQADRGNITLNARGIFQNGVLSATSALNNREGSIRLQAWGQGLFAYSSSLEGPPIQQWSAGSLTLGPGSVTMVVPDAGDKSEIETAALATRYRPGRIELRGDLIAIEADASVVVPAGIISIIANKDPTSYDEPSAGARDYRDGSRVYIGQNAYLSVAGIQDVAVAMERNFVTGEFRINELRDTVLYRNSWLRGQKGIIVDRRVTGQFTDGPMAGVQWVQGSPGKWVGTPLGDFTGWIGVGRTDLGELSTRGGSINIKSGGSIITRAGSLLDIAGGSVRYSDGWNRTTRLLGADGRLYNIGDATPDRIYVGIAGRFTRRHSRWGISESWSNPLMDPKGTFEKGYTEGRDAGSIQFFAGEAYVLEGNFWGGTIAGDRQIAAGKLAKAGKLVFGDGGDEDRPWLISDLIITRQPRRLAADFTAQSAVPIEFYDPGAAEPSRAKTTWVDPAILNNAGMDRIDFNINNSLRVAADGDLDLRPGSSLSITFNVSPNARHTKVTIDGTIRVPGGTVTTGGNSVVLGAGAAIDVSGQWVNDVTDTVRVPAPAIHGGKIDIFANETLQIAPGVLLNVSGGGWYNARARAAPTLKVGDAGSIRIASANLDGALLANLDVRGYAAGSGGSLEVVASAPIQLGGTKPDDPSTIHLSDRLFSEYGFRALEIRTTRDIVVPDGVHISQTPVNVDLRGQDVSGHATGTSIAEIGPVRVLPLEERVKRRPASLVLGSRGDSVTIGRDAVLRTDVGGSIALASGYREVFFPGGSDTVYGDLIVKGTIEAPAGAISLQSAWRIVLEDGSRLLARGAPVIAVDGDGNRTGSVRPGGAIAINAPMMVIKPDAVLDVSGASAVIDRVQGGLTGDRRQSLHLDSNGGTISFSGKGVIEGKLIGQGGGPNARGGDVTIEVPGSADQSPRQQLEAILQFLDPDCVGLPGGNGNCGDWQDAIGFNLGDVIRAYGYEYEGSIFISRALYDAMPASSAPELLLSRNAASPSSDLLKPGQFGLDPAAVEALRSYLGVDLPAYFASANALKPLVVRPGSINDGQFADIRITSNNALIRLDDAQLSASRRIEVSGVLVNAGAGNSALVAPHLVLGGPTAARSDTVSGTLTLQGKVIDLGSTSVVGFDRTILRADDIRLNGTIEQPVVVDIQGKLTIAGRLYPVTATKATVRADKAIEIVPYGQSGAPLSAGATLVLEAPIIEQNGALWLPFGTINFKAGERLTLGAGSLTSVSGGGLVLPYGTLNNNEHWIDPAKLPDPQKPNESMIAPPEKRISLEGPTVELAQGSTIDIRGGGDLHAWEFVPGPGGSRDLLAMPGMFAIMPAHATSTAPTAVAPPRDGNTPAAAFDVGDRIWLAGGNGLAAGWYTLLPSRYALLPGAYAIMLAGQSGLASPAPAVRLTDGSLVMSGRRGSALTGQQDQLFGAWRVLSGSVLRQYTEYNEAAANRFFASDAFKLSQYRLTGENVVTPRLPMDGGSIVFKATQDLILDGQLRSRAAEGGRGGLVDIAGAKIAIVGAGQDASALRGQGYLVIDSASLTSFGAGSLLVGGVRTGDAKGIRLDVVASDIVVRNNDESRLVGPEIILAASGKVAVEAGSVLATEGEVGAGGGDLIVSPQHPAAYRDPDGWDDGDPKDDILVSPSRDYGALIRVSNGDAVRVVRQNVDASIGGVVDVGAGAILRGGKSLLIDSTQTTNLAASARLSGASLALSSGRISLGGGREGLVLDASTLPLLRDTQHLTLRSYTSIDFYGSIDLGGAGLASVTFDASGLVGHGNGTIAITGGAIALVNNGSSFIESGASGSGKLMLQADDVVLGAGSKTIRGFTDIALIANRRIISAGNGTVDAGTAAVALTAPLLTGRGGSAQSLITTGNLTVSASGTAPERDTESLGTRWTLTGRSVQFSGRVVGLGGAVTLTASGGDVVLADGASIDVGGFEKHFFDVPGHADAGRVSLVAVGGSVRMASTALINLAGAPSGGNAGTLSVTASGGGTVDLGGRISAQAAAGQRGGSFALDIAALPDFAGLTRQLNDAGFSASRQFRIRNGNVVIDGATAVADFGLVADQGTVTLSGIIDARSTFGGRIAITAGSGLTMTADARLQAGAMDAELGSGRVTLEASGGRLDLQGGSIDVAGGEGGRVRLRAGQTSGHDGSAVDNLSAVIVGARSAVLEGVARYSIRDYDGTTIDSAMSDAVSHANVFASHAADIQARIPGAAGVTVAAGIEIVHDGDLVLNSDWNLAGLASREGGLTIRAGGNLTIRGHISDGFSAVDRSGVLLDAASWDLRLIAGADLSSASATALMPLAGLVAGKGSLVVGDAAAGRHVRTGTGDIDVRAARNLDLAHPQSVIYTAGRRDMTVFDDFTTAPATAVYGIRGGHLRIAVQGDVSTTLPANRSDMQLFTEWLKRQGATDRYYVFAPYFHGALGDRPAEQSSWWIDHGSFQQGVGALGGGNVAVTAGGDLVNLLVALPTNGRVRGGRIALERKLLEMRNGGAMTVDAGGVVRAGYYYVGRGAGTITAGEFAVGRAVNITTAGVLKSYPIAPVLSLGDATLDVRTAGDLRLQTMLDPLLIGQGSFHDGAYMSGQTDRSALSLISVGGDVILVGQTTFLSKDLDFPDPWSGPRAYMQVNKFAGNLFPSRTRITALNGVVDNQDTFFMLPGSRPELRILAEKDVLPGAIVMSRATPAMVPSPFESVGGEGAPIQLSDGTYGFRALIRNDMIPPPTNLADIIHMAHLYALRNPERLANANDDEPSRIYSRSGSIVAVSDMTPTGERASVMTNEQTWLRAGRDIRNGSYDLRNVRRSDVSIFEAGNDVIGRSIDIQGPGAVVISAGRDVYATGFSIYSRGNQSYDDNNRRIPQTQIKGLPTDGASITVLAGLNGQQPRYHAFAAAYLDPANVNAMPDYLTITGSDGKRLPIYLTDEAEERKNGNTHIVRHGLVSFVREITGETLSPLDAWARFGMLPRLTQERFLRQVYMQELRAAGRDQNTLGRDDRPINGGYNRGYRAIDTLLPGKAWRGDFIVGNALLRTMAGGDVDILTPGGGVQVAALGAQVPDGYGIVTLGGGEIRIFARDNVTVNRSRVLTFGGGDEILWSTLGDIDAGRGAKTTRITSAPDIVTDVDGNTEIRERPDMSGSGIGTIAGVGGVEKGDVDLIAPLGTVNPGDAGIRVAGNLNVAALIVLNVDNFEVEGEIKGVPRPTAAVTVAPPTTDPGQAAQAADDAVKKASGRNTDTPSIITVEVLGYGGGGSAKGGDDEKKKSESGGDTGQPVRKVDAAPTQDPASAYQVLGAGELTAEQTRTLIEQRMRTAGQ